MPHRMGARFAILAPEIFDGLAMRGHGALVIERDRVLGFGTADDLASDMVRVTLPPGHVLAPGFIDWQVNGGAGVLLNDDPSESALCAIAQAHQAFGATSLMPTLITDTVETMERLCALDPKVIPGVVGFHFEGPFINTEKRGAHPAEHVRSLTPGDVERFARIAEDATCLVTLAPERVPPGAIRALVDVGVIVSLGHSNASAECVRSAADEGATGVTHLFNAMSQIGARESGLVGAALADSRLFAGVIADDEHVAPMNLALAHRIMGADRLLLVSDAMPTVGALNASFRLLGREVSLENGRLLLADGTLAGAHLTIAEAVKRMVRLAQAPLADALRMATLTPARFLGIDSKAGMLRPGSYADIVALDADLNVSHVWLHGEQIAARSLSEKRRAP